MPGIEEVRNGDVLGIMVTIIISALGFFLALALANAIQASFDAILPEFTEEVARTWVIFGLAVLIVIVLVAVIVLLYRRTNNYQN